MAETPRRIDPILGKKEQRVVGLFSAGRGEQGGKMGVREEEEREEGIPGEGVSGVMGLEGGKEDGLELVSSVELRDSLRKWVYFVFGASSIMNLQCQLFFVFFQISAFTQALVMKSKSKCLCVIVQSFFQKRDVAICVFRSG